jgi:hypothetical protein
VSKREDYLCFFSSRLSKFSCIVLLHPGQYTRPWVQGKPSRTFICAEGAGQPIPQQAFPDERQGAGQDSGDGREVHGHEQAWEAVNWYTIGPLATPDLQPP